MESMELLIEQKYERLGEILRSMGKVVVAFSGGVDSAFLLKAALEFMGPENVLAITADSETYPVREKLEAIELAKELNAPHEVIHTSELNIPGYAENPTNRCYFCKNSLFDHLIPIARERGYAHVVFGAIADDLGEHRPGLQAAHEQGVRAPLLEAGIKKSEIRHLSRRFGLKTWDKPSFACLSSRIPYGEAITAQKLSMIDQAEDFLIQLGFRQVRVRQHENLARIEVPASELGELLPVAETVHAKLKEIGYAYVTLDLKGYRSGSLNEVLPADQQAVQAGAGAAN
ncbi:ATP-dependent sacrificial sulfur transferase LarE [Paenibacillus mucilaginosus]|uniref:PP-loop domain-containing protein n=3 Tax=Paenibacillus mucilaginosus TaxID=61624 RepID=H6NFM0_9BACL|nr:ATP-dependent sacrificial sulfur transferase LarE [Paenibacillus mucilaginosus]AEI41571.1 PP-loop domain protein [Paenibacillus mucilaginosus KNP414]AFC30106.1 PP-loop domain-containing protein [Paenibacillus mucilaginosus 3016]AFH62365.1 potassium-transporting ATPase subunit A [Paenibacillus mucilaginosus K02]MCG7215397.1 ATP-dependent sacrificial sulfur transferase LarE [Paenibacillus mucilaginosus]WDM30568.1 ATP-dependent sacrificial sulfur transferase LarE [Paenibacillus mucilaginosus]